MTLKDSIMSAYKDERKALKEQRNQWTPVRIRNMRLRLNYTIEEFALLLNASNTAINSWERGESQPNWTFQLRLQICEERYVLPILLEEQRMEQVKTIIDLGKEDDSEFEN